MIVTWSLLLGLSRVLLQVSATDSLPQEYIQRRILLDTRPRDRQRLHLEVELRLLLLPLGCHRRLELQVKESLRVLLSPCGCNGRDGDRAAYTDAVRSSCCGLFHD